MTDEDTRISPATYGWLSESVMAIASIVPVIAIHILRPEYYTFASAFFLLVCTWYVLRTIVDYATGNPIIIYLVRLQDPTKKFTRLFVVGLVSFILFLLYIGMFTQYF